MHDDPYINPPTTEATARLPAAWPGRSSCLRTITDDDVPVRGSGFGRCRQGNNLSNSIRICILDHCGRLDLRPSICRWHGLYQRRILTEPDTVVIALPPHIVVLYIGCQKNSTSHYIVST